MELKPPIPRLELLCHLAVKISAPQLLGPVLTGERRIIPIIGGRFEGQRLRGKILPGGADWQIVTADGTTLLEARYTLRTDDGALIYSVFELSVQERLTTGNTGRTKPKRISSRLIPVARAPNSSPVSPW